MPNALRLALLAVTLVSTPAWAGTYVPPQNYTSYLQDRYFQALGSAGYFGVIDPANNRLPLNAESIVGFGGVRSSYDPASGGGVTANFTSTPRTFGNANLRPYEDREVVLRTGFQRRVYGNLSVFGGTINQMVTLRFGLASLVPQSMAYSVFAQRQSGTSLLASGILDGATPNFQFSQALDLADEGSVGMVFQHLGSNVNEAVSVYAALDYTVPGYTIPDPPPPPPPTVPEPATWAQLLLGFFTSGVMLRRRRALPA